MRKNLFKIRKSICLGVMCIGMVSISHISYGSVVDAKVAQAYYNVLTNIMTTQGVYNEGTEVKGNGLVYASLQDFEGDGIPELYIMRAKNDKEGYRESTGGYVESIWGYQSGKAYSISSEYNNIGSWGNSKNTYLTRIAGKDYLIYRSGGNHGDGEAPYYNIYTDNWEIYTIEEGKLVKIEQVRGVWESTVDEPIMERKTFKQIKNSKTITINESTYNSLVKKYEGGKLICYGGAGAPEFNMDTSNNNHQLIKFYSDLENQANKLQTTIKDVYATQSNQGKEQLERFLSNFSNVLTSFDMSKYNDHELIKVAHVNQFEGLIDLSPSTRDQRISINGWDYEANLITNVNQYVYDLFGVKPDINRVAGKDFYTYYKAKDKYYFPSLEKGGSTEGYGTHITSMYEVGSQTYCVAFDLYSIDVNDLKDDRMKPYSSWNSQQKQDAEWMSRGYAVIKRISNNGKTGWNLLEYQKEAGILNNKQLNMFGNKYK